MNSTKHHLVITVNGRTSYDGQVDEVEIETNSDGWLSVKAEFPAVEFDI